MHDAPPPWQKEEKQPELALSVSQFIDYVNFVITKKQVVVEGEIASYNISQQKWVFFDLKDETSRVTCFTMVYSLEMAFEDGMQVRVYGTPRLHQKSGKFSIYVDRIELCGEGALKKAFELTKAKLTKEGIFALERKRSIVDTPYVIGLIASRESAAYTDFMRILNHRWGGLTIHLAHVQVQGERAVAEIVQAFEWFNTCDLPIETLVLIRGGGSLEDLHAFNSEPVVRAVFGSRIPVVCGVGHERDETLADFAADLRAATPTHAATLVVPDRNELERRLFRSTTSLLSAMDHVISWQSHRIERACTMLYQHVTARLHTFELLVRRFVFQVERMGHAVITHSRLLDDARARMHRSVVTKLEQRSASLSFLTRSLNQLNPYAALKRGYVIVKKKGKAVGRKEDLKPGDTIDLMLSDGELTAKILGNQAELF